MNLKEGIEEDSNRGNIYLYNEEGPSTGALVPRPPQGPTPLYGAGARNFPSSLLTSYNADTYGI